MKKDLLEDVDKFLAETGMGSSYFGKKAAGNSEIVKRLRSGGDIQMKAVAKIKSFIGSQRLDSTSSENVNILYKTELA